VRQVPLVLWVLVLPVQLAPREIWVKLAPRVKLDHWVSAKPGLKERQAPPAPRETWELPAQQEQELPGL
jgi:hypothetical protein